MAMSCGVKRKIVLDPGVGFGKDFEQNIEVLRRLNELKDLGYPILLGTSRKSVIGKVLPVEPKKIRRYNSYYCSWYKRWRRYS